MRSLVRRALVLGGCIVASVVASGCEGKQATEYVAGVSTQISVPKHLQAIRINISVGGSSVFCKGFKVFEGKVLLPRSLGAYATSDSAVKGPSVTFEIVGLTTDNLDSEFFAGGCINPPRVKQDDVRVLRRSRQPYQENEIKFLPMPIKYSCYDKDCPDDQTCKGGKCVAMDTDPKTLPDYEPELVDGTGGTCFRVKGIDKDGVKLPGCMDAAVQPIPVDADNCIYAVPGTPSAPEPGLGLPSPFAPIDPQFWQGVNVEVTYDAGLVKEVLDKDPDEGFTIPDPAKPQQFKLAPGLCEMVKGIQPNPNAGQPGQEAFIPTEHRITSIRTSGTCQAKTVPQPFCAEDQLEQMGANPDGSPKDQSPLCAASELVSPQSALVVIVDNTQGHQRLFDRVKAPFDPNDEDSLIEPAIRGALSDPAFRRTDMGLTFSPGSLACDGSGALDIALAPTLNPGDSAASAAEKFLNAIKSQATVAGDVALEGALERAYAALADAKYDNAYRKAVLVLGNGEFLDAETCGGGPAGPISLAEGAAAGGVRTYVMQLLAQPGKNGDSDALAVAGGTTSASWKTAESTQKFTDIVNSLATCVYDVDVSTPPAPTDTVAFTSPLTGEVKTLAFNEACNQEAVPGEGWGTQTGGSVPPGKVRIHLCESSCLSYREFIKQASSFAAVYQQDPLPVPVYRYQAACTEP